MLLPLDGETLTEGGGMEGEGKELDGFDGVTGGMFPPDEANKCFLPLASSQT